MAKNIITTELEGWAELESQLKELLPKSVRKHLKAAMEEASVPVVSEMKSRAPVRTGTLRDGISASRPKLSKNNEQAKVEIGPTRVFDKGEGKDMQRDGYYARFLEFGTSKMAAKPFIGPAFDARANEALAKLLDRLGQAIDEGCNK